MGRLAMYCLYRRFVKGSPLWNQVIESVPETVSPAAWAPVGRAPRRPSPAPAAPSFSASALLYGLPHHRAIWEVAESCCARPRVSMLTPLVYSLLASGACGHLLPVNPFLVSSPPAGQRRGPFVSPPSSVHSSQERRGSDRPLSLACAERELSPPNVAVSSQW